MQRLLHGLKDRLGRQIERGSDAGCRRRAEMGDVVDLVLVQADALHEIDLDLVSGGKAANQRPAIETAVLRDCQNWRNVVAGMRVVGGQERVVKIELAHGNAVGP